MSFGLIVSVFATMSGIASGASATTWHFAPAWCTACVRGTMATEDQCEAANARLAANANVTVGKSLVVGSGGICNRKWPRTGWNAVPLGCSSQVGGDWTAHYKTSGSSCPETDPKPIYRLICSGEPCVDTANWVGLVGFTCATYAERKFCRNGFPLSNSFTGSRYNYPERNCCVCGGGLPNTETSYTDVKSSTCRDQYAYWDGRNNAEWQNLGIILNPIFSRGGHFDYVRRQLDNQCERLCTNDAACAGYAVASDSFWNAKKYVCAFYANCASTIVENGNYHGFMKIAPNAIASNVSAATSTREIVV